MRLGRRRLVLAKVVRDRSCATRPAISRRSGSSGTRGTRRWSTRPRCAATARRPFTGGVGPSWASFPGTVIPVPSVRRFRASTTPRVDCSWRLDRPQSSNRISVLARGQGSRHGASPVIPVLEVDGLRTEFRLKHANVVAVDGVSFNVDQGECVGVVGESGSARRPSASPS